MILNDEDFFALMAKLHIGVTTLEHEAIFTVSEQFEKGLDLPKPGSKNLFLKDKKKNLFLISALHETVIDLKSLHKLLGAKGRLSFADTENMMSLLGVSPGSVTPFGLINDRDNHITFIIDADLMACERVNFHPLRNDATTTMAREDFIRFLEGIGHNYRIMTLDAKLPSA